MNIEAAKEVWTEMKRVADLYAKTYYMTYFSKNISLCDFHPNEFVFYIDDAYGSTTKYQSIYLPLSILSMNEEDLIKEINKLVDERKAKERADLERRTCKACGSVKF